MTRWQGMKFVAVIAFLSTSVATRAEVIHASITDLPALQKQGLTVVDVRTPPEWQQTGVVAGSKLVPLSNDAGFLKAMDMAADPSRPVVLICRSGNRSGVAARMLEARYPGRKIYNIREGMNGWLAARQPVVTPEQSRQAAKACGPAVC